MKSYRLMRGVKFAVLIAAVMSLAAFVVMSLWNWLVPALFGGPGLHFWQALGLLVLSRVLFGRIGGGPGHRMAWREPWGARWQQMTPEERERFRETLGRRCGPRGAPAAAPKV